MAYNTYPAVDENYMFPPEVRTAIASSNEVNDRIVGKVGEELDDPDSATRVALDDLYARSNLVDGGAP